MLYLDSKSVTGACNYNIATCALYVTYLYELSHTHYQQPLPETLQDGDI